MADDPTRGSETPSVQQVFDPQEWERRVAKARERREKAIAEREAEKRKAKEKGLPVENGGARIIGFDPTARSGEPKPPEETDERKEVSPAGATREEFADRLFKATQLARSKHAKPAPGVAGSAAPSFKLNPSAPPKPGEPARVEPAHSAEAVLRAPAESAEAPPRAEDSAAGAGFVQQEYVYPRRRRRRTAGRFAYLAGGLVAAVLVAAFFLSPDRLFETAEQQDTQDLASGETEAAPAEDAATLEPASGRLAGTETQEPEPDAPDAVARLDMPDDPEAAGSGAAGPSALPEEAGELAAARPERPGDFSTPSVSLPDAPAPPVTIEPPRPDVVEAAPSAEDTETAETAAEPDETEEPAAQSSGTARVYIHAPVTVSQDRIDAAVAALEAIGYPVQSVSRINLSVSSSNVRYFFDGDLDQANDIGDALRGLFPDGPAVRDFTFLDTRATSGHIEVWLSGASRASVGGEQRTQPVGNPPPAPTAPAPQPQQPQQPPAAAQGPQAPTAVDPNRLRSLVETARDP